MGKRAKFAVKKSGATKQKSVHRTPEIHPSESVSSPIEHVLHLQRTIGNRAVNRLLQSGVLQAKLKIGQPGDIYELEADRVADQVMRMTEPEYEAESVQTRPPSYQITPLVQRQPEEEEEEEERRKEEEEIIRPKLISSEHPVLQRQAEEEEEEEEPIQPQGITSHTPEATPDLESRIKSVRGGGQPLPQSAINFFGPRFNRDFSQVRIHTDSRAADVTRALNAKAFTMGRDVMFGAGQYAPGTEAGKRLLSHELTHVLQQGGIKIQGKFNVGKTGNISRRKANVGITPINRSGKISRSAYIQNKDIRNHKLSIRDNQRLHVSRNSDVPSIQRYGRDVHMDNTLRWATAVFRSAPGARSIPPIIAREDQGLDEGWTHPTWTSIASFFTPFTPLHFPSRTQAVSSVSAAIRRAEVSTSPTFDRHAADFGRQLHRYQDSYSHSFPPGAPYNRIGRARGGAPTWLRPTLFALQRLYPNTVYGKGAVIRHVILGYYPDDYMRNSEQRSRDRQMRTGSIYFLRRLLGAYRRWLSLSRTLRLLRIPGRWRPSILGPRRVP